VAGKIPQGLIGTLQANGQFGKPGKKKKKELDPKMAAAMQRRFASK
jgi:hypothetical protein